MISKPEEAGVIVAKHYNLSKEVGIASVKNLTTSRTQGVEYWGSGQFNLEGLKRMVELQKSVGALTGDVDLNRIIDTQFLPEDIRKPR
jgi:NitT/TauT family transport system substrate-binding protein